jgi:hypothetical protein
MDLGHQDVELWSDFYDNSLWSDMTIKLKLGASDYFEDLYAHKEVIISAFEWANINHRLHLQVHPTKPFVYEWNFPSTACLVDLYGARLLIEWVYTRRLPGWHQNHMEWYFAAIRLANAWQMYGGLARLFYTACDSVFATAVKDSVIGGHMSRVWELLFFVELTSDASAPLFRDMIPSHTIAALTDRPAHVRRLLAMAQPVLVHDIPYAERFLNAVFTYSDTVAGGGPNSVLDLGRWSHPLMRTFVNIFAPATIIFFLKGIQFANTTSENVRAAAVFCYVQEAPVQFGWHLGGAELGGLANTINFDALSVTWKHTILDSPWAEASVRHDAHPIHYNPANSGVVGGYIPLHHIQGASQQAQRDGHAIDAWCGGELWVNGFALRVGASAMLDGSVVGWWAWEGPSVHRPLISAQYLLTFRVPSGGDIHTIEGQDLLQNIPERSPVGHLRLLPPSGDIQFTLRMIDIV